MSAIMAIDFSDISYLSRGGERQKRCHAILMQTRIMEILAPYGPLVAGTIPIGIDTPSSDIDIVCEVHDTHSFSSSMEAGFGGCENYRVRFYDGGRVVCSFLYGGEQIEVYGSPIPAARSNAWRHLLVEARLLDILGPDFRREIVALKERGVKTEPAFALVLGLEGDAYQKVLELGEYTDRQLARLFR